MCVLFFLQEDSKVRIDTTPAKTVNIEVEAVDNEGNPKTDRYTDVFHFTYTNNGQVWTSEMVKQFTEMLERFSDVEYNELEDACNKAGNEVVILESGKTYKIKVVW